MFQIVLDEITGWLRKEQTSKNRLAWFRVIGMDKCLFHKSDLTVGSSEKVNPNIFYSTSGDVMVMNPIVGRIASITSHKSNKMRLRHFDSLEFTIHGTTFVLTKKIYSNQNEIETVLTYYTYRVEPTQTDDSKQNPQQNWGSMFLQILYKPTDPRSKTTPASGIAGSPEEFGRQRRRRQLLRNFQTLLHRFLT